MTHEVLLFEDNEVNSYLIRFVLEQAGFDVRVATNGLQGLAEAKRRCPHLILMDIGMPIMDGYEATRRIKADVSLRHVPVVALSAHAMEHEKERALEAGCVAYIEKPIDMTTFVAQVKFQIKGNPHPE